MEEQYILEMIDIQKRFPGVQALKMPESRSVKEQSML